MAFVRHYRHLGRYREIANVLARYGFGMLVDQLGLRGLLVSRSMSEGKERETRLTGPRRLLGALQELGPTFVKLGQILSTRPDLLPRDYIEELEKLQDTVPPFPFPQVEELLERELGLPWSEIFASLSPSPLASASIGQVHLAQLKSGETVVVKVQRPGVERIIEVDLEILFDLARVLETRTAWGKQYGLVSIVEEFSRSLSAELDYSQEGRNADRMAGLFKDDPRVVIPRVYWEYSTRRVLVMEYLEAIKISDTERLKAAGYNCPRIAQHLVEIILKQIYEFGFFHTDPHPGNLGVLAGERLVLMDFGQVGHMSQDTREKAVDMVLAMVRYDVDGVMRSLLEIGVVQHRVDRASLRRDLSFLQEKYYGLPLAQIKVGEALRELVDLSFKYQIRIPPEFVLAIKCLITTEGVVQQLHPQISMLELAENFARQVLRRRFELRNVRRSVEHSLLEVWYLLRSLPRRWENVLGLLEEGEIKIVLEHKNLPDFSSRLSRISNRLVLSILLGSLIIGSSLMAQRSPGGLFQNLPVAEIGFTIAAAIGFWLVISIIRSGR